MLLCCDASASAECGLDCSPGDAGSCMSMAGFDVDRSVLRDHDNVRNLSEIGDDAGIFGRSEIVAHRSRKGQRLPKVIRFEEVAMFLTRQQRRS